MTDLNCSVCAFSALTIVISMCVMCAGVAFVLADDDFAVVPLVEGFVAVASAAAVDAGGGVAPAVGVAAAGGVFAAAVWGVASLSC